ncbi:hydroxymethylglutaryl-CoA lyase [Halioxenophilus sp. WMMB6]|uniref:hydroxymethylglutaryl-CoA lyase n=1 Tax=Halioxenophilus sp. WMMB6 TaxID=3073815 RepID=UPI00295E8A69|nr:hydroxymethylglutaryl-CoA lyase [Halioxenophilus sp. WMMB6]
MSDIIINEVGLRDGLQNQSCPITTDDKQRLFSSLWNSGLRNFEVTSFVHPKAVPQMADAEAVMQFLPDADDAEFTVLVPNRRGYERAVAAGAKAVAVVLTATDTFNRRNIQMSLEQATAVCREIIDAAGGDNIYVRAYVSAACGCPYEGPVSSERVFSLVDAVAQADEISIADTIGCGGPRQISELMTPLVAEYGCEKFNLHLHDTRGLAVANAWAGLQAGVRRFDASIGGLGGCPFAPGAAGNLATEDLVVLLHQCGYSTGIDLEKLLQAIVVAEEIVGHPLGGRSRKWLQQQDLGSCQV